MMTMEEDNYKTTVVKFLNKKGFSNVCTLGRGGFADVLAAKSTNDENVAIKIIKDNVSWVVEEQAWPHLKHENVLPLLNVFEMPEFALKLYISPRHPYDLQTLSLSKAFRSNIHGFSLLRKWFSEILNGLQYMHEAGFAHMDLKSDNILISCNCSAQICDFSGIALTDKKITRLCSPLAFRPPECWTVNSMNEGVNGVQYDMWTFGLMALNVLTGHWFDCHVPHVNEISYERNIRPVLLKSIEIPNFYILTSRITVPVPFQELEKARNFVFRLLNENPGDRPNAKQASEHPFLRNINDSYTQNYTIIERNALLPHRKEIIISQPIRENIGDFIRVKHKCADAVMNRNDDGNTEEFICENVLKEQLSEESHSRFQSNSSISNECIESISNTAIESCKENFEMPSNPSEFSTAKNSQRGRMNFRKRIKIWLKKKWIKLFPKSGHKV